MSFFVREIHPNDNVNNLSLGNSNHRALKSFLKKQSKEFHNNNIAKTFVLVDDISPSHVKGFLSLSCSEITLDISQKPSVSGKERYDNYPAIKIVRLAIDKSLQRKNLGSNLIKMVISIVKNKIMPHVGCRYISVDSKPDAIEFYKKMGFILLDAPANKTNENPLLFLDMHILEEIEE